MTAPSVVIASDHAGFALKEALKPAIRDAGFTALDLGTDSDASVDYPDFAAKAADALLAGQAAFGILVCGSGIGMSIAANRRPGIRAALCHQGLEAQLARQHNNANILALGARLIGPETAKECVIRFLTTAYEGGRHEQRVKKLDDAIRR